jgi:hypothetical protein
LQSLVALFFTGNFEKEASLLQAGSVLLPIVYDGFKGRLFFEYCLSLFGVVPKIRLRGDLMQFLDPLLFGFDVKDASAIYRVVAPGASVAL